MNVIWNDKLFIILICILIFSLGFLIMILMVAIIYGTISTWLDGKKYKAFQFDNTPTEIKEVFGESKNSDFGCEILIKNVN